MAGKSNSKLRENAGVLMTCEEAGGSAGNEPGFAGEGGTTQNAPAARCERRIPALRGELRIDLPSLDPVEYARSTCYQAGHLVTKNAGWRSVRPVLNLEACTKCLQCYLYCPDGTVYKVRLNPEASLDAVASSKPSGVASPCGEPCFEGAAAGDFLHLAIDYDFCKGCGICARICKFDAITMIPESEAHAR